MLGFCMIVLLFVVPTLGCREAQEYPALPGRGYNIAIGCPLDTTDQGIMPASPFVAPTDWITKEGGAYENGCYDWSWKFPSQAEHYYWLEDGGVEQSAMESTINSVKDYQNTAQSKISGSADGDFGFASFSFTASATFDNVESKYETGETISQRYSTRALAFHTFVIISGLTVTTDYWHMLLNGYTQNNFELFVGTYGTHIIKGNHAGARATLTVDFNTATYQISQTNSKDFQAGLEGMYKKYTASVDASHNSESKATENLESLVKKVEISCRGGSGFSCDEKTFDTNYKLSDFMKEASKTPAMLKYELVSHKDFIIGDDKWNDFVAYVNKYNEQNNKKIEVDLDEFSTMWEDSLQNQYCSGNPNRCNLKMRRLPAPLHVDLDDYMDYNIGTKHDSRPFNVQHPPTSYMDHGVLATKADSLRVMEISMTCYEGLPISFQLTIGDDVNPPIILDEVGSSKTIPYCNAEQWCDSGQIQTTGKYFPNSEYVGEPGCGFLGLRWCMYCCDTGTTKKISKPLAANQVISSIITQKANIVSDWSKMLAPYGTMITQLQFEISNVSDPESPPVTIGCEGNGYEYADHPQHSLPVHRGQSVKRQLDWKNYRLLNYEGSFTRNVDIASLSFRFYNLQGANDTAKWSVPDGSDATELSECVMDMFHSNVYTIQQTDPSFALFANGKTGDDLCAQLGLGKCASFLDSHCFKQPCSLNARTSWAVGCLMAGKAAFSTLTTPGKCQFGGMPPPSMTFNSGYLESCKMKCTAFGKCAGLSFSMDGTCILYPMQLSVLEKWSCFGSDCSKSVHPFYNDCKWTGASTCDFGRSVNGYCCNTVDFDDTEWTPDSTDNDESFSCLKQLQSSACVHVNNIYDKPGFYQCSCVDSTDACLADGTCVYEPACPASNGQPISTKKPCLYSRRMLGARVCKKIPVDEQFTCTGTTTPGEDKDTCQNLVTGWCHNEAWKNIYRMNDGFNIANCLALATNADIDLKQLSTIIWKEFDGKYPLFWSGFWIDGDKTSLAYVHSEDFKNRFPKNWYVDPMNEKYDQKLDGEQGYLSAFGAVCGAACPSNMNIFFDNWSIMFTAAAINNMVFEAPRQNEMKYGIQMISNSANILESQGARSFESKTFWQREIPFLIQMATTENAGRYVFKEGYESLKDVTLYVAGGGRDYKNLFDDKYKTPTDAPLFTLHIHDCGRGCPSARDLLDTFFPTVASTFAPVEDMFEDIGDMMTFVNFKLRTIGVDASNFVSFVPPATKALADALNLQQSSISMALGGSSGRRALQNNDVDVSIASTDEDAGGIADAVTTNGSAIILAVENELKDAGLTGMGVTSTTSATMSSTASAPTTTTISSGTTASANNCPAGTTDMGWGWCACWGNAGKTQYYPLDARFCVENMNAGTSYTSMNGYCMSGSDKVGLMQNWFVQPGSFCEEMCNEKPECTGYIIKDTDKCATMPGDLYGENVNTVTAGNNESGYTCMRKAVNTISATFEATGVTEDNLHKMCSSISVTLEGNTQRCTMNGPNTVNMDVGIDNCELATTQIDDATFGSTVQQLPVGITITKSDATSCNDGSVIPNVPTTTTTTAASGTTTYTLDGRYRVGMLNNMRPQMTQIFAQTLGVDPTKVSLVITRSVIQFKVTDTQDYTPQLSAADFKDRFFSNVRAQNQMLALYMGATTNSAINCIDIQTAGDCWGFAKPAPGIFLPTGMMQACTWIPGINRCMPAGVATGMAPYDPTENEVKYEDMLGPMGQEIDFESMPFGFDTYGPQAGMGYVPSYTPDIFAPASNPENIPTMSSDGVIFTPSGGWNPYSSGNLFIYENTEDYCKLLPPTPKQCKGMCVIKEMKCEFYDILAARLSKAQASTKSHSKSPTPKTTTWFLVSFFFFCGVASMLLLRKSCKRTNDDNNHFIALDERI